ncbi:hypothetical protein BDV96DRAFT_368464 [Lophiotrema nucula]|uniref:Uncharacterized protein n=1 Tax=Lophiotrema nucula TaxID=690887 RepID=A0A6A5ZKJ6_9PLEO|nr:hypothetical protein BDV96DRAFT_368464 [Lophiotrema nucula]
MPQWELASGGKNASQRRVPASRESKRASDEGRRCEWAAILGAGTQRDRTDRHVSGRALSVVSMLAGRRSRCSSRCLRWCRSSCSGRAAGGRREDGSAAARGRETGGWLAGALGHPLAGQFSRSMSLAPCAQVCTKRVPCLARILGMGWRITAPIRRHNYWILTQLPAPRHGPFGSCIDWPVSADCGAETQYE